MQAPPLGEADVPQLLQLLHGALSMDAGTQKQAEALLASLESRVGFCSCLAVRHCALLTQIIPRRRMRTSTAP